MPLSTDIRMHTICLACTVTKGTKQLMPVLIVDSACSTHTVETLRGYKRLLILSYLISLSLSLIMFCHGNAGIYNRNKITKLIKRIKTHDRRIVGGN